MHVTSPGSSSFADYQLSGIAYDNTYVTSVTASLDGAEPLVAELTGDRFSASMNLQPGLNSVTVTATDAAGNEGQHAFDVSYLPSASGLSADRDVAMHGQTVVLTGRHLGESGSVELGGIALDAVAWTDSEIRITVPSTAPSGPQILQVNTSTGRMELDLFVGVAFDGPDLGTLAGLALPKGTAVRLGSGMYSASEPVLLDNLSLYGQGRDTTIIRLPAAAAELRVYADFGFDLVWQDLSLEVDSMFVHPEPDPTLIASAVASGLPPGGLLPHVLARLEHGTLEIASQDGAAGSFKMLDVRVEQQAGGSGMQIADSGIYATRVNTVEGDVVFENVKLDSQSALNVAPLGNVVVVNSELSGSAAVLMSLASRVSVVTSSVSDNAGGTNVFASRGLSLTDSEFSAAGPLSIHGHLAAAAGHTLITGSTFNASDTAGLNSINFGPARSRFEGNTVRSSSELNFGINGPEAAVEFVNNEITSGEGINYLIPNAGSSLTMTENTVRSGHDSIFLAGAGGLQLRVQHNNFSDAGFLQFDFRHELRSALVSHNMITAGSGVTGRGSVDVRLRSSQPFVFRDNDVTFPARGYFYFFGNGNVRMEGNRLAETDSSSAALVFYQQADQPLEVIVTDNEFVNFRSALYLRSSPAYTAPFNALINDNHFNFAIDAAPQAAEVVFISAAQGELDARNNIWGTNSDAAAVQSYVTYTDSDTELLVAPIRLP